MFVCVLVCVRLVCVGLMIIHKVSSVVGRNLDFFKREASCGKSLSLRTALEVLCKSTCTCSHTCRDKDFAYLGAL